ncbi:MAG: amidohydrolase family protein [Thermoanaerobaculales bacterium]|jgi:cytosine/adenosine deaminase-related metal-dependent hydrolase|nr:amidohydrolase family protein [Thermoanaerobaculales bacterium]
MSAALVIRGGTVVPMERDREWFTGDVVVRDGRIADLVEGAAEVSDATVEIDARGAAVVPGFIQCHVHVVQSLLRHQADGLSLLDWLHRRTLPYEAALDGDGVAVAAQLGIAELLCGGTTTVLDFGTTHDHDRVFEAARDMGIRMISGRTHMDTGGGTPPELLESAERSLADAEAIGKRWHGAAGGRLGYAVAPRFALSCTRDLLEGCVGMAREHGWLLHSHASENTDEVAAVRAATGRTNIAYLAEVGLTGDDVVLAHGVHLDHEEIEILAESKTRICHCPGANLKLGSGIADVPRLRSAGVPVALGADGPPCNNRLSAFHEMSLAATLHGLRSGPTALDAWDALAMATREGAHALHLDAEVGTLSPGKAADITVVDLDGWSTIPGDDPAARLVHGASATDVRHVLVGGARVVEHGRLTSLDHQVLRSRVDQAWKATRSRMTTA